MDRRKALATAAAVTMSLTSAVIAIGANVGALGLGGAPAATAVQQSSGVAAAPAAPTTGVRTTSGEHESDDAARASQPGATTNAQPKGENDA